MNRTQFIEAIQTKFPGAEIVQVARPTRAIIAAFAALVLDGKLFHGVAASLGGSLESEDFGEDPIIAAVDFAMFVSMASPFGATDVTEDELGGTRMTDTQFRKYAANRGVEIVRAFRYASSVTGTTMIVAEGVRAGKRGLLCDPRAAFNTVHEPWLALDDASTAFEQNMQDAHDAGGTVTLFANPGAN